MAAFDEIINFPFDESKVAGILPVITRIAQPYWDTDAVYVAMQTGRVYRVSLQGRRRWVIVYDCSADFAELPPLANGKSEERGLIGLCFSKRDGTRQLGYSAKPTMYLCLTLPASAARTMRTWLNDDGQPLNRVSRLRRANGTFYERPACVTVVRAVDAHLLGKTSPLTLHHVQYDMLGVEQPETNHNGGALVVTSNGTLLWALGDGGGAGDEHGREAAQPQPTRRRRYDELLGFAQDESTWLGKIIAMPAATYGDLDTRNGLQRRPETLHRGLRNPWSMQIGPHGELYVGDVGQDRYEAVKVAPRWQEPQNFGWRAYEARHKYSFTVAEHLATERLSLGVLELEHENNRVAAITGCVVDPPRGRVLAFDLNGTVFEATMPWLVRSRSATDRDVEDAYQVRELSALDERWQVHTAGSLRDGRIIVGAVDRQTETNAIFALVVRRAM